MSVLVYTGENSALDGLPGIIVLLSDRAFKS